MVEPQRSDARNTARATAWAIQAAIQSARYGRGSCRSSSTKNSARTTLPASCAAVAISNRGMEVRAPACPLEYSIHAGNHSRGAKDRARPHNGRRRCIMERRRPYLRMRVTLGAALGVGLLTLSLSSACAHAHAKAPSGPRKLDHLTPQARAEYIRRAAVWHPTKIPSMDLLRGPQGKGSFEPDQQVTCDYVTPDKKLTGDTPKFLCDLSGGDVVKVKYHSGEVYAEVAASRLLVAIGFGSERAYPGRVACRHCPIEPWFWSSERRVAESKFQIASIQRKLEGKEIALS